jgi:hypothetical protein
MPAFSEVENLRPPSNVTVPPDAFSSTWTDRPDEPECIGLRFVPDQDLEDARIEAYKRAAGFFPDHEKSPETTELFIASFQDALVRWVIARGTCDPNNVHKPWHAWAAAPEDIVVEQALTDNGAQLIYDAWERMRLASNIGLPVATDEDIALLPELLVRLPAMALESRTRALRLRRLLRFVLEELESVPLPDPKALPGATSAPEPPSAAVTAPHVHSFGPKGRWDCRCGMTPERYAKFGDRKV